MRRLVVVPLLLATVLPGPATSGHGADPPPVAERRAEVTDALAVLHRWDAQRAAAWAGTDEQALRSLYLPGSGAGRSDVRLLRAYTDRGLVVRRLVTQVFAVTVVRRTPRTWRLRVLDRVAGGRLTRGGRTLPLPSSPPVTRTVTFRLGNGGWRVAGVSDSGRAPRAARR